MCMLVEVAGERSGLLSKVYENPKYNAAFDRCIDVMAKLMLKYGNQVLEKREGIPPLSPYGQPDKKEAGIFGQAA